MLNKDWKLRVENKENKTYLYILINKNIDVTGLEFSLIDEERHIITNFKVNNHEMWICNDLTKPIFAQLGDCIKYIKESGKETYKNIN